VYWGSCCAIAPNTESIVRVVKIFFIFLIIANFILVIAILF